MTISYDCFDSIMDDTLIVSGIIDAEFDYRTKSCIVESKYLDEVFEIYREWIEHFK